VLVHLDAFLVAPDIAQLGRFTGGLRNPRTLTVNAVLGLRGCDRHKAGHLPVLRHLDFPLRTPYRPGRRSLTIWL